MQIQSINNQFGFTGLSVIPKGSAKTFTVGTSSKILNQITDTMTKSDKTIFINKIVKPLEKTQTEVLINFNNDAITIIPKTKPQMEMKTNKLALISDDNESIAMYPLKDGKYYSLEYDTTSDAESRVGYYNFRYPGMELIGKSHAAVDIAKHIG